MPSKKPVKLKPRIEDVFTYNQIQDLLSACTCGRYFHGPDGKDPAPLFFKSMEAMEKKLWAASHRLYRRAAIRKAKGKVK